MTLIRSIISLILLVAGALSASAATVHPDDDSDELVLPEGVPAPKPARLSGARGYYMTEIDGEEVKMIVLHAVTVYPPLKFKNKKEQDFYWRTVRDVRRTLPYAKLICATLIETYEYIETFPTQREREEHLKKMEGEVFKQYKPVLKRFSRSQARMLVKLIKRETDQSSYDIIKAFLGSFRAGFWQTFGRLFGVNLKGDYNPEKDRQDAIIEQIATAIELGQL